MAEAARGRSFGLVRAAAFPGDSEASGGLLLDLASDRRHAADERPAALGRAMSARLREPGGVGGDRHRQRRLLVQDLADAFLDLGGAGPLLVVLEDLHWADELSLEVVGHLAARLLLQRLAEEIRLHRLDPAQTAALAGALLGHPPPAGVAAAVHDRSDGIPLHVEELLAALPEAATGPDPGGVAAVPVPDTLADAVLARARGLDEPSLAVARAGAVIGRSFELDLLGAVSGLPADAVDHGLRRLQELYLVQPSPDQAGRRAEIAA